MDESALVARWRRALPDADHRAAAAAFEAVAARHAEAHRRYHDLEHVSEVVAWADRLSGPDGAPATVTMAAFLHDLVYDPHARDNEAASAAEAERILPPLGVSEDATAEVTRLILITVDHVAPQGDLAAAVLCDADLAILGAEPDRYQRYVADVRAEYSWVDDDAWHHGRRRVLAALHGRTRLYVTDQAHQALDGSARRNLADELSTLGA